MANNSISKYIKKPSTKSRSMAQKSGSWVANAFKSIGYSTFDVLQELLPSTIDAAKVTATTGKDIADSIRRARTSDRTLQTAINRNYYVGLGREVFRNSLEDLKSGKFYNKDRADQFFSDMNDDMLDFGDFENFDDGENFDDFSGSVESSDGNAKASFSRKKGKDNSATSIVVNTNLGPDSAIYQATQYQTETMVNVGQAVVDFNKANSRATLVMLGNMRNEFNASLGSINENISTIVSTTTQTLSQHSALSAKFYEDSIALQTQILEAIKGSPSNNTQVNTRTFKEYEDVTSMFTAGGMVDPKSYANLVKKQLDSYIDNNMFLSQLKFMAGEKETLKMMAQNPLAFVPKAITKQLIPSTVKSVLQEFDAQLKETSLAALNQVSGLQRSNNPLLAALGKIFGVQNKITISSIDKGAYNKGATAWTGTDHQALVNVIPTLLRKIHASVSGSEEIAFNYETGQFQKVRDMEKQAEKDKLYRETSGYSEYKAEFKEFMDKNLAISREQQEEFSKDFEKFISALVRDSAGGRTFRKGGRTGDFANNNIDDIRDLLGKTSSDDDSVKLIRAYLSGMEGRNNAALTRFFGSALQEQRATLDRTLREMQADPTKYNTMYIDTGLGTHSPSGTGSRHGIRTDSHLSYYKEDPTRVKGVVGGLLGQDQFGRTQTDYLRDILKTLNTGIYVVPIGKLDGASDDGSSRLNAINSRLNSQSTIIRNEEQRYKSSKPKKNNSSYVGSNRQQRDLAAGKIEEFTQEQIEALGETFHDELRTSQTAPADKSIVSKLLGMLPQDSGAARMLGRVQKGQTAATNKVTEVVNKLDSLMLEVVFGNPKGHKGFYALFDKTLNTMKAGFGKFALFLDNKILKPLDETIFGEDGIVNKVKQTEVWTKFSEFFKNTTEKAGKFFLGDLGPDGKRTGGLFSETANSLKDMGTHVKEGILGKKGPDGKPIPLDKDDSVLGNLKRMFKKTSDIIGDKLGIDRTSGETFGTKLANGMDMMYARIKERADQFSLNVFGDGDKAEWIKQFQEDMKGQKGYIGASAVLGSVGTMLLSGHMGLLGSIFLPGGPIGGAILGAGIGIASKSTGLKNFLFGPEDDNRERTGGIITKEMQDFFKQNKTGIKVGAIGGLAASFGLIPSLFVPGGPIGGALIGGALSFATKSQAFQDLLYGEGGTKDDPTGGVAKKLQSLFGKDKNLKGVAVDAGIGAGVGLLGSFFLPGGPIIGALLGSAASVGLASDKFQTWFFGDKNEETGKREGGVFGKFSGFMKDEIFSPLSTTVKIAQTKILGFVEENMVIPFKYALKPLTEEAKYVAGKIKEQVTGVFTAIKDKFHEHVTKPIGDAVKAHFLDPMKKMLNKVFSGLGRLVGNIIAAPFRMFSAAGRGAYENQKGRGRKSYDDQLREEKGFLGSLGYKIFKNKEYRQNRKAAQFGENGAWYDPNGDYYERQRAEQANVHTRTEAKIAALRNNTSVDTSSIVPGASSSDTNVPRVRNNTRVNTNNTQPDTSRDTSGRVKLSRRQRRDEAMRRAGINPNDTTSVDITRVKGNNLSQDELKEYLRNKFGRTGAPSSRSDSSRNTSGTQDTTRVSTVPTASADQRNRNNSTSAQSSSENDKRGRTKDSGTFLQKIQKDVSQIVDSVYGQLNGVGSNVNKIYRMMLKTNKMNDEDIKGDNNKEYMGFLGRLRTKFNRPFEAIKDIITSPFRKIADIGHSFVDKIKNFGNIFGNIGNVIKAGLSSVAKGIGEGAKAIGGVVVELAKIPGEIIKTGLTAVRELLPALGEVAKATVGAVADGIKIAGSVVVDSVKTIGGLISGSAKGFGQLLGGAMSGLGSVLSTLGLITKDVAQGIWSGVKKVGGGLLNAATGIISAPFNLLGNLLGGRREGEGKGGLFGRKGPVHVIVDSGTLDTVKRVKRIERQGGGLDDLLPGGNGGKGDYKPLKPVTNVKPLAGGFGKGPGERPIHVIIDDVRKTAFEKIREKFGSVFGKSKDPMKDLDRNVGDTSVDSSMVGGGSADDAAGSDSSLADDDNRTSVASSIENLKSSMNQAGQTISDSFAAIKDKFSSRISARQAQVDKGSRASMLERFAADDKAKEESEFRSKLLSMVGKTTEATTEHKSIFSSIFSKKGLITGAIIALFPMILKFLKNIHFGDLIKNILDSLATGWNEIGGIKGLINNLGEKGEHGASVVTGKENNYVIDESGHLVYDEKGNPVKQEEDINRVKALLTPSRTRIDTKSGEFEKRNDWTQMSGSTANLVSHKAVIPALNFVEDTATGKNTLGKVINGTKAAGRGVGNWLKSGAELNALKKAGFEGLAGEASRSQKIAGAVVGAADDLATKVVNSKAVTTAKGAVTKVASGAKGLVDDAIHYAGGSEVVQTFIKKASEAINFLVSKLAGIGEKFGLKLGTGQFGNFVKNIMKVLTPKRLAGFGEKIGKFLKDITGKSTVAGATAFIAEIGFVVYGAINGAVNAGALFEVNPEDVDAKMRAISAVFKGLLGTTVGSVIDFINSLVAEILGTNFIKDIATHTYNLLSNEEDKEALKAAQQDFTKGYEDYVSKEYEAYKKNTEESGQQAMSFEDFKASDLSTTRSEYNSQTNKSIFRRAYDAVGGIKGIGNGIKKGVTSVVNTVKGGPKAIAEGLGNLGKGAINGIKTVGSGIVGGAKKLGTSVVTGVKDIGGRIANSKVGQFVGGVGSKIGEGASAVYNKGKEIFGNVGEGVKKLVTNGIDAGKAILTGYKTIAENFYNKDNSFMDYMKADVNSTDEDNIFHGIVGAILNVAKVTMFPKLLIAGILKKVGKAVADAATKIFTGAKAAVMDYGTNTANIAKLAFKGDMEGLSNYQIVSSEDNPVGGITSAMAGFYRIMHYPIALISKGAHKVAETIKSAFTGLKTAASDYATNTSQLNRLAFAGDIEGLGQYEITTSEDNPISGFTSGILGINRIMHYPIALVAKGARKVAETVKGAISGVRAAGSDYLTNVANIRQLALAGDFNGLGQYEITTSEDNPVAGFTGGILGISRIMHYPMALVVAGGKKVAEGVKNAISTVVTVGNQIGEGSVELGKLALSGDVSALHGYQGVDEEGNPVGGFANAVLGVEKVLLTPMAYVTSTGKKIADFVKGAVGTVVDYGSKSVSFVKTLNAYTDPDKDLRGWKNESMATDESDVVGSVLGNIIKKVMWVYVGIVRSIKGAFDWVGDVVDTVKGAASSAWDWIGDKVNAAGTAIMNLGRGGRKGGRPLYGGKGGDDDFLNGMPYYSQNDPEYKNKPYRLSGGRGDDTIGDAGCGPTAMAMVASKVTGREYNPITMARMAEEGGYSTQVGTTPGYFSAAGNALGIPNAQVEPSANNLAQSLANGDSVVLQGARGGFGNSPYTSEGHYVTATGMDDKGNVLINDPRGKEYSGAYRMSDLMSDTTGMWSFAGSGGYGVNPDYHLRTKVIKGGKGPTNTTAIGNGSDYERWISIVRAVKQAIANQHPGYSQSRYITITVGGRSMKARTDCSGYVQTCLKYFGVMNENSNLTSYNVMNAGDATMKATGFTPYSWPGWDNLREGDILGKSGHTEIFAYNKDGKHYVYNCGDDSSTNSPTPTGSGSKAYTTIWRCGSAGSNALSNYAVEGGTTYATGGDYGSSDSGGAAASSGPSSFADLFSGLADAALKPIYKKFGFNTGDESSGTSVSSGGDYSSSFGGTFTEIPGGGDTQSNAVVIAKVLKQNGFNNNQIAGILSNWTTESGIDSTSVETIYDEKFKIGNKKQAALSDFSTFTTGTVFPKYEGRLKINKSAYQAGDGKYYAGIGLGQWTGPRAKLLFDYARSNGKNWYDVDSQINFMLNADSFRGRLEKYKRETAKYSPRDAAKYFENKWEGSTHNEAGHQATADSWASKLPSMVGGAGGKGGVRVLPGGRGGLSSGRPLYGSKGGNIDLTTKAVRSVGGYGIPTQTNYGAVAQSSYSASADKSALTASRINGIIGSGDTSQLIKMAIEYLSKIADNTGTTNSELEELNKKDFGNKGVVQNNTTNNVVDNSNKSYNNGDKPQNIADRTEYAMAKRVAAGILD